MSPYMFVAPFTKDHFSKTTEWVSLTRATATAVVHDRIVESWFATFGGSRWRCAFLSEARALLDLAAVDKARCDQLRAEAVEILKRIKAVIPYAGKWQLGDKPDEACIAPQRLLPHRPFPWRAIW